MKKVIVTGGGGFVGKALCLELRKLGYQVISFARGKYPDLEEAGIQTRRCDISENLENFKSDFEDAEAIFHTAAYVKMWGDYNNFYKINFLGTKNLVNFAIKHNISKFIYTSSPSVVADGKNLQGINESYPYPKKFKANYPKTKALAEQYVLEKNSHSFKTLSLRPHLIWGEGDNNFVPTIIKRAKEGKLVIVGDGKNKVDFSYIKDCIQAHLCALTALDNNPKSSGKAYFISQGEPYPLWDWINEVLVRNDLPKLEKKVSFNLAYSIASVLEFFYKTFSIKSEPRLTRFLVSEMATDHYFDISRARTLLGYEPKYTIKQAFDDYMKEG